MFRLIGKISLTLLKDHIIKLCDTNVKDKSLKCFEAGV